MPFNRRIRALGLSMGIQPHGPFGLRRRFRSLILCAIKGGGSGASSARVDSRIGAPPGKVPAAQAKPKASVALWAALGLASENALGGGDQPLGRSIE
jgi:hypothetical protein